MIPLFDWIPAFEVVLQFVIPDLIRYPEISIVKHSGFRLPPE